MLTNTIRMLDHQVVLMNEKLGRRIPVMYLFGENDGHIRVSTSKDIELDFINSGRDLQGLPSLDINNLEFGNMPPIEDDEYAHPSEWKDDQYGN